MVRITPIRKLSLIGAVAAAVAVAVLIAGFASTITLNPVPTQKAETGQNVHQLPTAHAGADQKVKAGTMVTLDGSGSDASDKGALTYDWSLRSVPKESVARLFNHTSDRPTFTPDKAGTYVVSLVVADSEGAKSTPDVTNVTVIPAERSNTTLSANVSTTDISIGDTVVISGRLVDAEGNGIPDQTISFKLEAHVLGITRDVPVNSTTTDSTGAFMQSVPAERQDAPSFITEVNLEGWAVYAGGEAYKSSTTEHVNMVVHL